MKTAVRVRTKAGDRYSPGLLLTPYPAFAVVDAIGKDAGSIALTHVPTGYGVAIFDSAEQAVGCASELAPLSDWENIERAPKGARAIVEKWGGRRPGGRLS